MKYLTTLTSALGLLASVSAVPIEERDDAQTVHLTFHGGPATYSMAFPADGTVYPTSNSPPFPIPCRSRHALTHLQTTTSR
jgi:hypothetical protein